MSPFVISDTVNCDVAGVDSLAVVNVTRVTKPSVLSLSEFPDRICPRPVAVSVVPLTRKLPRTSLPTADCPAVKPKSMSAEPDVKLMFAALP
jgi:hypothetical protein